MLLAPLRIWVFLLAVAAVPALAAAGANPDDFPVYDTIQPNISFWTKIYTEYTTTQAIVHDDRNLDIIYEVIDLKPHDAVNGRKINRRRMKQARAKYQKILKHLASNPGTRSGSARQVAELFGPRASAQTFRSAGKRVRCQIGQSDRFRAGLIRSGAYIDQIRDIFKVYGLPEALAYLPHVESSFDYKAYSKFGAAGIWQFTRSTGKRFMQVGYVLDERRDPISATHAAAALLKENYEKLGSWPLAITAYNHGAAGMANAKSKHGSYPRIVEKYRSRTFKFASRNFYSEFLAASLVASNYRTYFGELFLDKPLPVRTVTLDGYVAFNDLCSHFNVSAQVAKTLNPALRPPVFNGQKYVPNGYTFRMPAGMGKASVQTAAIPSSFYKSRQKPSSFYTVQRGDTAGRIARVHGVNLSDLILANNLSARATIYPKQTLRIPLPGELVPAAVTATPENTETMLAAKAEPPEIPAAEKVEKPVQYPQPVLASVIPTISSLADTPKTRTVLQPTDMEAPSGEIVSVDVRFERISHRTSYPVGSLEVEVEETLGHFAEWAAVRTQAIRRLNGLAFGSRLQLHQKVKIPLKNVTAQQFEEQRYEYHKRLQEDFFAVYRIGEMSAYGAKRGDNLWNLSLDKFDIPTWLLKNCNPDVDFSALRVGQKLMIPIIEKNSEDPSSLEPEDDSEDMDVPVSQDLEKKVSSQM